MPASVKSSRFGNARIHSAYALGDPRVAYFSRIYRSTKNTTPAGTLKPLRNERGLPFFCLHPSKRNILDTRATAGGTRDAGDSPAGSAVSFWFGEGSRLSIPPLSLRHKKFLEARVRAFRPDIVHVTGPSEPGILGAVAGEESEGSAGGLVAYQSPRVCCAAVMAGFCACFRAANDQPRKRKLKMPRCWLVPGFTGWRRLSLRPISICAACWSGPPAATAP